MKNIASALVKAQREFAPALKTNANPFFKSKYADLSVCIEAVIDALHNNGIALIQRNHDCDNGVKVETILLHESGEEFSGGVLHVPAIKSDPQAYGSALTYARRYSLMATCGIAPEDDDGNAAARPIKPLPAPNLQPPAMNDKEFALCVESMGMCADLEGLKGIFGGAYKRCDAKSKDALTNEYNHNKTRLEKAA
jgi:hypothetical protein